MQIQDTEQADCSICGEEIGTDMFYDKDGNLEGSWDGGHNAEPVNNGRCCEQCNDTVVTPFRLRGMGYSESQISNIIDLVWKRN